MNNEEISAKMELKELVDTFSNLADIKDAKNQGELFLPDGVLEFQMGFDGEIQNIIGREALVQAFAATINPCKAVYHINGQQDGVSVYVTGDTSKTEQMPLMADMNIDYAFFCCDGRFNMDLEEAAECAELVQAKHNIPYHTLGQNGSNFDRSKAEMFPAPNRLIIDEGEEIGLIK